MQSGENWESFRDTATALNGQMRTQKLRGPGDSLLHVFPYGAAMEMTITSPPLTRQNDPATKWVSDLNWPISTLPQIFLT